MTTFCALPPDSVRIVALRRRGLDAQALDRAPRQAPPTWRDRSSRGSTAGRDWAGRCCSRPNGRRRTPGGRDPPAPARCRHRWRRAALAIGTGLPLMRISPLTIGWMPASTRASDERPLPSRPATPTTSPRCRVRSMPAGLDAPETPRASSSDFADRRRLAHHVGEAARAAADDVGDHRFQRELGHRRRDDMLAVAQDRGAVGDAEDLVHAVRDVDDGDALAAQLADIVEQALDLVARQRRGRLVEHQDLAGLRRRLDDLGQLAVAGAECRRPWRSGRCRRPCAQTAFALPPSPPCRRSGRKRTCISRLRKTFCATVSVGTRLISWNAMATPAARAASAVKDGQRHAADLDRPRRRRLHAAQDLQDRRLAGAVLAEQRMHLARQDVEIDIVERANAAEAHVDVPHANGTRCGDRVHRNTLGYRPGSACRPAGRRQPPPSGRSDMGYCMLCLILSVTGLW